MSTENVIFNECNCILFKAESTKKSLLEKKNFLNSLAKVSSNLLNQFNANNINETKQNELKENILMLINFLKVSCNDKQKELDSVNKKQTTLVSNLLNEQELHNYSYEEIQNFVLENMLIEKNNTYNSVSSTSIKTIMDVIKINELEESIPDYKDCLFYETIKLDLNKIRKNTINDDIANKKYINLFDRKNDKKFLSEQLNAIDKRSTKLKEYLKELQTERKKLKEDMGYTFMLNNKKFDCRIKLDIPLINKENSSDSSYSDDDYALEDDVLEFDDSVFNNTRNFSDESLGNRYSGNKAVLRKLPISERKTNPLSFDNSRDDSDSNSFNLNQLIDDINKEISKKKFLLKEISNKNYIFKKMKNHLKKLYYKLNYWDNKMNRFKFS